MKKIRICIIGNSVALRIRPRENGAIVYGLILKDKISRITKKDVELKNLSVSRLLTDEVIKNKGHFLNNDQDITILNLGCVDAPSRDIPLWFSDIIFKRKGKLLYNIFNPFYLYIISKFRAQLVRMRGFTSWVSIDQFSGNVADIICNLKGKSKIVVLGINSGNQRIENQLPKTLARYRLYNNILESICQTHNILFISTLELESEDFFPDGVHYNSEGHKLIAQRIYDKIKTDF